MKDFIGINGFVWWQGVVEDINDPLKIGRCRVRVIGFHTSNKVDLPSNELPWAIPMQPINSAAISGIGISPTGLVEGSWVFGFFRDGTDANEPIIIGSIAGISTQLPISSKGFNDPNEKYPTQDYLNESDVNRLARNENIDKTIVKTKKDNTEKNITGALGKDWWEEPQTPYNASYPKNNVYQSESGHTIEVDDTPGSERLHTYHKSGTFEEIYPSGDKVTKIITDKYEIILEDKKVLIKGNETNNIKGNLNSKIENDCNIEIQGNVNLLINGNITMQTDGDFNHKIKGNYTVVSESNMIFLAKRIDLNPNGISYSDISDPISPTIISYDEKGNIK